MKKSTAKKSKTNKDHECGWTIFVARISLALIFVLSLVGKLMDPSGTINSIGGVGFPIPEFFYIGALVLLAVGSLSLILGYRVCIGAMSLVIFTVVATLMFHVGEGQLIPFLKNLAIVGGLLALTTVPKGKLSLEK